MTVDASSQQLWRRLTDWPRNDPDVLAALQETFATGDWGRYHGEQCKAFVQELASYHAVEHVQLCASGTVAVELALHGLGITPGDEVVIAGYDFPGNFRAVEAVGARPVLVDVKDGCWTFSAEILRGAVASETKAVIVSHLHGNLAPILEIADECQRLGLRLVEDACQVTGAMIDGKRAGSVGDAGVLSFGGSKLLTSGRGGAVLTDQPDVAQRIRIRNDRGNEAFPLSELQAAVLRPQLRKLDELNRQRLSSVALLRKRLGEKGALRWAPASSGQVSSAYFKLGAFLEPQTVDREAWVAEAVRNGVPVGSGFRGFYRRSARRCRQVGELVNSRRASERTVLMHHPALLGTAEDLECVATILERLNIADD